MGCDWEDWMAGMTQKISIHAARMGCDCWKLSEDERIYLFQSTQPEWAATINAFNEMEAKLFQSTQPEWAATRDDFSG